jgi:hypothetical protein
MFFREAIEDHYGAECIICRARVRIGFHEDIACKRRRADREIFTDLFVRGLAAGAFGPELVAHPAFVAMCLKLECAATSRSVTAYVRGLS